MTAEQIVFTLVIAGLIIGIPILLSLMFDRVYVDDPDIGLVKRFGKIIPPRLLPGKYYHLWRFGGLIKIDNLVQVPGGEIIIPIPIDEVITHDVVVDVDVEAHIIIYKAPDGYNAYQPSEKFINLLHLEPGDSLLGHNHPETGEYVKGKLEQEIQNITQDACERVIKRYKPHKITKGTAVFDAIKAEIQAVLSEKFKDIANVVMYVQGVKPPDAVSRKKRLLDAENEAAVLRTQTDAELDRSKRYRDEFGLETAQLDMTLQAFVKKEGDIHLNTVGNGIVDAAKVAGNIFNGIDKIKQFQEKRDK